jgi:hypothetical protein
LTYHHVLPNTPDDPLPFVGQGAHREVMATTLLTLLLILSRRPPAGQNRFLGLLMKALPEQPLAIGIAFKEGFSFIATEGHVVDRAGKLDSQWARHGGSVST